MINHQIFGRRFGPLGMAALIAVTMTGVVVAPAGVAAHAGKGSNVERITTDCHRDAAGQRLRVRIVELTRADLGGLNFDRARITVRATSEDEGGDFRNPDVELGGIQLHLRNEVLQRVRRAGARSPFVVEPVPTRDGHEIIGTRAVVTFVLDGARRVTVACSAANELPTPVGEDCRRTVDGQSLGVRLRWESAGLPRDDLALARVVVRATDDGERARFRDERVDLRHLKVTVIGPGSRDHAVYHSRGASPFVVELDGRDVIAVLTVATFRLDGGREARLRYATHVENLHRCSLR